MGILYAILVSIIKLIYSLLHAIKSMILVSMAVSLVALAGVAFLLTRTRIGKATRAVSDNVSLAASTGIDVEKIIRVIWIVSGALTGL